MNKLYTLMSTYTYFDNTGFNKKKYENEISKNRDDLDKKLSNLYKNKDVIKQTQQKEINANAYANIMLTILGTCILYFTFFQNSIW
jgi:hypothetical protein